MEIKSYLCDICLQDGKQRKAKHYYVTEHDIYDICRSCLEIVKEAGYEVKPHQ